MIQNLFLIDILSPMPVYFLPINTESDVQLSPVELIYVELLGVVSRAVSLQTGIGPVVVWAGQAHVEIRLNCIHTFRKF